MQFPQLTHGYLIKRYKRFLADVKLDDGEIITAHCTNSGSMKSCIEEGAEVYLSPVNDPNRKTRFTWEMIKINRNWVGVNTSNPNKIAFDWIKKGIIPGLEDYADVKREVTFGDSRFDIYAEKPGEQCFVEVKNVTLKDGDYARFPDAKTERGLKHLETLISVKQQGIRAVMLYVIQRIDVSIFAPAWDIDPAYAKQLVEAFKSGVEVIPLQVRVSPQGIEPLGLLRFELKR